LLDGHLLPKELVCHVGLELRLTNPNPIGILDRVRMHVSHVLQVDELVSCEYITDPPEALFDGPNLTNDQAQACEHLWLQLVERLELTGDAVTYVRKEAIDPNPEEGDQVIVALGDDLRNAPSVSNPVGNLTI
jgi:hypothetical protein